jgi:hypothetical protein
MTIEAWSRAPAYLIQTAGPYTVPHPYASGAIRAWVIDAAGVRTDLAPADYTLAPSVSEASGALTLMPAAFAQHKGRTLIVDRDTTSEQGWQGGSSSRERGLERQLDIMVMVDQENQRGVRSAVRLPYPVPELVPQPNMLIGLDADGVPHLKLPSDIRAEVAADRAEFAADAAINAVGPLGDLASLVALANWRQQIGTGNGVQVAFTLPHALLNTEHLTIWFDGHQQHEGFGVSGTTVTFTAPPLFGVKIWAEAKPGLSNVQVLGVIGAAQLAPQIFAAQQSASEAASQAAASAALAQGVSPVFASYAAAVGASVPSGTFFTVLKDETRGGRQTVYRGGGPYTFVRYLTDEGLRADEVGLIGDNTTINTTSQVPEGANVNLLGRRYVVAEVPTHFTPYNGAWVRNGRIVPLPSRPLLHAFDGQPFRATSFPGQTLHTGGLVFRPADRQLYRVICVSASHAPEVGAPVLLEVSDDLGQNWRHVQTIYSDGTRSVRAMATRLDGDTMTVVVSTHGSPNKLFVLKADAPFHSWTETEITGLAGDHFLFGELHRYPTAVGGNDTTGLIFYTYEGEPTPQVYAVYTVNGTTWAEQALTNLNDLGINEISICRHGTLNRWTGLGRVKASNTANRARFVALRSTDLLTWATDLDSGIENMRHNSEPGNIPLPDTTFGDFGQRAADGNVGTPPLCYWSGGKIHAALFYRESWAVGEFDNNLQVFSAPAEEVWAANGSFRDVAPHRIDLPERALGMGFAAQLPGGGMAMTFRAEEGVYDAVVEGQHDSTSNSLFMLVGGATIPAKARNPDEGRNLWLDPGFSRWSLGTSWSGVTDESRAAKGPDGTRVWTSGASFDIDRVALPADISSKLCHRPHWAMRLNSTAIAANFSGWEQTHWGIEAVRSFSQREVLFQIWGYGPLPAGALRASVLAQSVVGDELENLDLPNTVKQVPVRSFSSGLWRAVIKVRVPRIDLSALGALPRIILRVTNDDTNAAWDDFHLCGMKVEFGAYPTPLMPADKGAEDAAFARRLRKFGFANPALIGPVGRTTSTNSNGIIDLGEMHHAPNVAVIGAASNFQIIGGGASGAVNATALSVNAITPQSARAVITHASSAHVSGYLQTTNAAAGLHFYLE